MEDEFDAMMEEDGEDENDEDDSLILSIGEDGKASIYEPKDYIEMKKTDIDLIKGFIKENQKLFNDYLFHNSY